MKKKTFTQSQTLALANLSLKIYSTPDGLQRYQKELARYADFLLGVGPGRKVDGLRSTRPKNEVLMSSDYLSDVVQPARQIELGAPRSSAAKKRR